MCSPLAFMVLFLPFLYLLPHLHSLFQSVCPDFPAVLLLVSVLFVDVGDEEEAGPLRRFQNSRERCKFLAPSISVSVPEDDPYHSDEEYYEHPLFSPEWTHSGSRPTGQAVAFRQIEGEPRMVPLCHFSPSIPLSLSHILSLYFYFLTPLSSSSVIWPPPSIPPSFRPSVSSSVSLFFVRQFVFPSVCVCLCVLVMFVRSRSEQFHVWLTVVFLFLFISPKAIATSGCYAVQSITEQWCLSDVLIVIHSMDIIHCWFHH